MNDESITEELSPRAEIFRSKLIEDFQLLDIISSKGGVEAPKFYSNEIIEEETMTKLLKECPQGLIKFQMYSKKDEQRFTDRRLNRIKNKNTIPLGPWAHTIVEDSRVQNFMMILIITNSIVLGIQAEISKIKDPSLSTLKLILNIFDYCALVMFVLEIIIKWIDGFWDFWKNGWNIFDFFVTVMSFAPEIIAFASGKNSTPEVAVIAENLRVFRILRSLKMVSRFAQLRIIVLTILKAFKSMAFILILLVTFMYIFAVAGTVMFDSYSKSNRTDLKYKTSFSSLGNALITLFQLFTLDHWYDILQDMVKVADSITVKIYIILWICIGAFIFRNIFAGIMVMNFQNIRNDFNQQVKEQTEAREAEQMRQHLAEELDRQDKMHAKTRRSSSVGVRLFLGGEHKPIRPMSALAEGPESDNDEEEEAVEEPEAVQQDKYREDPLAALGHKLAEIRGTKQPTQTTAGKTTGITESEGVPQVQGGAGRDLGRDISADWNSTIAANLMHLKNNPVETLWPRDTLFRYFQLMESLQENLAERQQLLKLAAQAMARLHDT